MVLSVSTDTRTVKRRLIDYKLLESDAGVDLAAYARTRRPDDSWGKIAASIFQLTGEHVTVPWLITQLPELIGAHADPAGAAS